jgi:transposase InsO family protein
MKRIELPEVPRTKITDEVLQKVESMLRSIGARERITEMENSIAQQTGLNAATQRRYKSELRKLFGLSSAEPLYALTEHPQIREALAAIIMRKKRSDAGSLASTRGMIVVTATGEHLSVENFLVALYAHPGHNANKAHEALMQACRERRVLREVGEVHDAVPIEELPSLRTVTRFLSRKRKIDLAIRRARMNRSERTADSIYIPRPDEEYRPGGLLEGDHTEDNILVYREDGKIAPLWCTMLVDVRTGLIKGYELSYRPNSNTIALAFKRACLGTQIYAAVGFTADGKVEYAQANLVDAPDRLRYDNGKDYKSRYTGETIGSIDFNDEARKAARLICEIEHTGRRHPQAKGHVEGTFAIIQQTILKYLPGFKGSNYQQKPDALAAEVKAGALLTEQEYRQLFQLAVNTVNNRPRKDLGDVSPLQYYLMNQAQMKYVDPRALDFLQMKWSGNRNDGRGVKISRGFVRMLGCEYFSMDLDAHNGEYAHLYYDPNDIGYAAVYIDGEFVTVAVDKDLVGVSEKDWLAIVKERARRNKEINEEIMSMRQGFTLQDAKALLFNAAINSVQPTDPGLLRKKVPAVVHLTGIESKAKEIATKMQEQKTIEEEKKKKKRTPLSLVNIDNIK